MRWILLFVLASQAAMCGQKGPLYLPDKSAFHTKATASEQHPTTREPRAPDSRR